MFNFVFSELLLNNNQFLSGSRFKKHIFCSFFFYETTKAWDDDALLCDLVQCRKLNIGQICRFRMYRLSFWFCQLEFYLYFINSVLPSEGTGTRNTREPTHIWLLCAELELTNPSQIDIWPKPYPTNLVPVPLTNCSYISKMQISERFFPWKPSPIISALFLIFKNHSWILY